MPQYPTLNSTREFAGKLKKPMSWKKMQEIVREERVQNYVKKNPIGQSKPKTAKKMIPYRIVPATEARSHFGKLVQRVHETGDDYIVTKSGTPIAAIISIQKYLILYPEQAKALGQRRGYETGQKAVRPLRKLIVKLQGDANRQQ